MSGREERPVAPSPHLSLRRELFAGRPGTAVAIGVLMLISVGSTLALPLVVVALVDAVTDGRSLVGIAAAAVILGIGSAVSAALATYLLSRLGEDVVHSLRTRVVDHALRMRVADLRAVGSGDVSTRLTADALQVKAAIDIVPIQLPMAAVTLVGTVVVMAVMDATLLLVTLAGFALAVIAVGLVIAGLRRHYTALQDGLGELTHRTVGVLEAITVVKSTRSENGRSRALAESADYLRGLGYRTARLEALVVPTINFGQQVALLAVLIGGGARIASGELSVATFVGFLLYLLQLTAPVIMAASGMTTVQAGLVAKKRFTDLFATPLETENDPPTTSPPAAGSVVRSAAPAVRFRHVRARKGETEVLAGVDFEVPRTGLTAIVGPSGAGKSTTLEVIERLSDHCDGTVEVFGRDVRGCAVADVREQMSYLDQYSTLVPDTVRANLQMGAPEALSDEQMWGALDAVGMADDIRSTPDGLDTALTVGRSLSGGQCQRLALARVLLARSPLVLLDEPTSALDAVNENRLRDVVSAVSERSAVLVVAHRLSTVHRADRVVVMDGGRVIAAGTHAELMAECGLYSELVSFQLGADRTPVGV
ncbi:ABC transporter ATP-binding protein [Rhodococcoides corynebacterioides]|uniref:ABC transporter ATP-binding protein n=1 Tax=Rhodococcoides corynebacterioides TaxID=53972 RepID=UPI001C9A8F15|nr:ABC transporter ATP-binding protein [Rhodococcus corynebacterioides]MBY6350957.1 ABC transporter ATP-binding protein [Rhodococcus corynebacterioides]